MRKRHLILSKNICTHDRNGIMGNTNRIQQPACKKWTSRGGSPQAWRALYGTGYRGDVVAIKVQRTASGTAVSDAALLPLHPQGPPLAHAEPRRLLTPATTGPGRLQGLRPAGHCHAGPAYCQRDSRVRRRRRARHARPHCPRPWAHRHPSAPPTRERVRAEPRHDSSTPCPGITPASAPTRPPACARRAAQATHSSDDRPWKVAGSKACRALFRMNRYLPAGQPCQTPPPREACAPGRPHCPHPWAHLHPSAPPTRGRVRAEPRHARSRPSQHRAPRRSCLCADKAPRLRTQSRGGYSRQRRQALEGCRV